jgi:uncharacterized protein Smg (DUF494 family)
MNGKEMDERIVDIIVYLLNEIQQGSKQLEKVNLTKELLSKGYTDNEINLAFSWIFNRLSMIPRKKVDNLGNDSDNNEDDINIDKLVISPEAYGYLIHLIKLGVIYDNDIELVVEHALSYGKDHLEVEDLKSIIASILFDRKNNSPYNNPELNRGDIPIQ